MRLILSFSGPGGQLILQLQRGNIAESNSSTVISNSSTPNPEYLTHLYNYPSPDSTHRVFLLPRSYPLHFARITINPYPSQSPAVDVTFTWYKGHPKPSFGNNLV
jgi:hypothetical protein